MRPPIFLFVEGAPKGQPRARACIRGKRAGVYDPGTADGWKAAVAEAWRTTVHPKPEPLSGAVKLTLTFFFQRPRGHFGTGRNAGKLKESAPKHHTSKPDLDNLAKAVMDVLTRAGAWTDDQLVSTLSVKRLWTVSSPGCQISIREANE